MADENEEVEITPGYYQTPQGLMWWDGKTWKEKGPVPPPDHADVPVQTVKVATKKSSEHPVGVRILVTIAAVVSGFIVANVLANMLFW